MNFSTLSNMRARLVMSAAFTALSATGVMAQAAAPTQEIEQVVVSSTRLQSAGFDAPTPTTVISADDIAKNAQASVFDAITQLPALQGSTGAGYETGSTTTGLQGLSALGLRGLSPLRTLVLLDGQRVVGGNFNGVVDVSQMPQMLIQRVDVVTGGASASWGSDAIAGVINFVTQKKFEGFKFNAMGGTSTYGDDNQALVQFAAGTGFLGGRAHIEVAGEYSYTAGLQPRYPISSQFGADPQIGGRSTYMTTGNANYTSPSATPAGQPQYFTGPLTQSTSSAAYGLVTNGPAIGTTFGQNGLATPYKYAGNCATTVVGTTGTLSGNIGSTCFGTSANPGDQTSRHQTQGLIEPIQRGDIYSRLSYDIGSSAEIYATVNLSEVRSENIPAQGNSDRTGLTIKCDNAFLPQTGLFGVGLTSAATTAACNAAYPTGGFGFGTSNANIPVDQQVYFQRDMRRFVVGGDGAFDMFGSEWSWDSYFEHGETDTGIKIHNEPLSGRYNLAMDAVQNSAGQIVCRNANAQANGCVPYNPFGTNNISAASIAYIDGQQLGPNVGPYAVMTQRQEAFSASVNGTPFSDWAGKIAVAAGIDYREEEYTQRADPYSAGISAVSPATAAQPCNGGDLSVDCVNGNSWNAGNYHNGRGTYHVSEAFLETGIPLIDSQTWGKADLDLAGRVEAYSTSGQANTWKLGATWDTPITGVRLRALQSRDVRAPNLSELFAPPQGLNGSINNDFTGVSGQSVRQLNVGNPALVPEKGQTTEVGIVYQPDWLPGFQASVDYYRITVKGVIQSLTLQNVEDLCYNGFTPYCAQTAIATANGVNQSAATPGAVGSPNAITAVYSQVFNQAGLLTDGFDFESAYAWDFQSWDVPGNFVWRSLINHTSKFISNPGVVGQPIAELAGVVGGIGGGNAGGNSATYNATGGNVLSWKADETESYQTDNWGVTFTQRWYAGGVDTPRFFVVCNPGSCPPSTTLNPTINANKVPDRLYFDIGAQWNFTEKSQFYVKVDNVGNVAPPNTGSNTANNTLYDVIGRFYRIGVRFND